MNRRWKPIVIACGLLAAVTAISIIAPRFRRAPSPARASTAAPFALAGVLRDFPAHHPDFGLDAATDPARYAGTVARRLGPLGRPEYIGAGFRVDVPWRDAMGRAIAPHLYRARSPMSRTGIVAAEWITLRTSGTVDGFDPALGPPGGPNAGRPFTMSTNATGEGAVTIASPLAPHGRLLVGAGGDPSSVIDGVEHVEGDLGTLSAPAIVAARSLSDPAALGANTGAAWYRGGEHAVLTDDLLVTDLRISSDALVDISGDVTIIATGDVRIESGGRLRVLPGASLDLHVGGAFLVRSACPWSDPRSVRVSASGPSELVISDDGRFFGTIVAPEGVLRVADDATFAGSFAGRAIIASEAASVWVSGPAAAPGPCGANDDAPGSAGPPGTGQVTSSASFEQWFAGAPAPDRTIPFVLPLLRGADGIWTAQHASLHPVDGRLLGNEGASHNRDITLALRGTFGYEACSGGFVEFTGGDGAWLFIDGMLAVDLGGVGPGEGQFVDLDRLGLASGEHHTLHLFYAQRHPKHAELKLRTSVALRPDH